MESVYKYVKELCVAVVLVSGSGRAADFVALACSKVTYNEYVLGYFFCSFEKLKVCFFNE